MQKINLVKIYRLGAEIKLRIVTGEPMIETWTKLSVAAQWLHSFLAETANVPVPKTRQAALALLAYVHDVSNRMFKNIQDKIDVPINSAANVKLQDMISVFEQEFEHESRELNVFSVSDVGTHSTTKLLDRAELNVPPDVRSRLKKESIDDINAAGRCLAFNLPTAAAFHILRAVEPVILDYHNTISGIHLPLKSRSWGTYRTQISKRGGDPKVVAMIDHIKDFYRNPIVHPEETLNADQALSLFHTCLSAIVQLDAAIQAWVKELCDAHDKFVASDATVEEDLKR
jgi:hypothetical protein